MKRTVLLLSLVGAILSTSTVFATDRHVPSVYPTIQAGIDAAVNGDRVIIAQGTYTGAGNRELDFGGRAITVQSTDPNNWDVVAATIIDCQYGGRGFHFHSGETASSVLAGLTITKGYTDHGGGVYCEGSSPTIRNCIFSDNIADYGGGMENQSCSPTVANCMFVGNGVFYYGGGMYNSGCTLAVSNCIFAGNSADWGGGIENANCSGAIVNCTFTGNSADLGGGMDNSGSSGLTVSNCILWGDTAPLGPEINGSVSVSYSDVQGGSTGTGNINADPCFVDAPSGDYHLLPGSACIDAGTNGPAGGLPATDIEGIPRPLDGDADGTAVADMGSYEFPFTEPVIALSATYFEFAGGLGGPDPNDQILYVSNSGAGTLNWTISEGCGWLWAEPTRKETLLSSLHILKVVQTVLVISQPPYKSRIRLTASSRAVAAMGIAVPAGGEHIVGSITTSGMALIGPSPMHTGMSGGTAPAFPHLLVAACQETTVKRCVMELRLISFGWMNRRTAITGACYVRIGKL